MKFNLIKIHKITTVLAVGGTSVGSVLFFLAQVDQQFDLNLLPGIVEPIFMLLTVLAGVLTVPSIVISAVISLYRIATKE